MSPLHQPPRVHVLVILALAAAALVFDLLPGTWP
jgi:hypothetical protein